MFMFYRKTTLVCARVYKNFTDGGCGCGCGANRRGASVSIGPNHSTYLCPLPSFFLQYSSQRRTTLLSYPTLPYLILSCPVRWRPLHTLVRNRNICRNLYSYLSRHARTLTHCTTWWRAHLSLPLKNLCACTRVCDIYEKKKYITLDKFLIYHFKKKLHYRNNKIDNILKNI